MTLEEIKKAPAGVLAKGNFDSLFRAEFVVADSEGNKPNVAICNGYIESWENSKTPQPTQAEIDAWASTFPSDHLDTLVTRRNRSYNYPNIGDQLDALFHAGVFPEDMAAQIQAVKDKYPKG